MGQGLNSSNSKNSQSNSSSPQSTAKLKLQPSKTLPVEATSVKSDAKGKVKENAIVNNGAQKKDDTENLATDFGNRLPDISMIQTEVCGQFGETHSETLLGLDANTDSDILLKCTELSLGNSNDSSSLGNVENTEPSVAQLSAVENETRCKQTKDSCLRNGLTLENADDISITDLYLMLGMPPRLKFEYEFANKSVPKADNTLNTLQKLVHLAKTQLTNTTAQKQKMVSVGTVTSPVRGIQPAANSATNRVGVTPSRSKSDVAAAPGSNKEIFRIAGAVGNGNLNVPNGSIVDIDKGVFVTPKASFAPSVLKSQAQEKLFMQQLRFIHRQSINQRKGRKSRPPIVVQRHLLPRIQSSGPIRNMMSLSTSTGKFTPVDASSLNSVDPVSYTQL
ncbi:protein cramped-like [Anneissia japonica]|uniref:protein cramped-like n=1 Tax=Anneissia japonica TaxID=1529436 RepID=UPI0014258AC2|nr:protein cramped-like [Anneissia japonica]